MRMRLYMILVILYTAPGENTRKRRRQGGKTFRGGEKNGAGSSAPCRGTKRTDGYFLSIFVTFLMYCFE